MVLDGNYWHFKGVVIEEAGDNGMLLSGNNNTIENCIFRENHDTGLQLSRYDTSASSISQWPSNNLIPLVGLIPRCLHRNDYCFFLFHASCACPEVLDY